ncbi:maleylpyruvate isomerase N-terminal domain-containing protein [Dictyobacter aurantiacus]|uniref:DinB-like domain-containing protein n=1 Tax=Dictyobacter aurantiacus TaxID=1936993 RepID=A0A401ZGD6_9CHLR|nr:maleylpyruvate isomerase N-terminal domain-containing protein [Dictyobacter aurantiacus]GCE05909.1 hypothetical protein KDAU_32380 [Dictyobacter aurantiacus]
MSATQTLENSHLTVLQALDDLPEPMWDMPGVCGEWSAKDIVAHLTSCELLLIDVCQTAHGEKPSPYLLRWANDLQAFNDETVGARRYQTAQQVMNEYQDAQVRSSDALASLPADLVEKKGVLNWYKTGEASIADLVEGFSRHAKLHSQQIVEFRTANKQLE